MKLAIDKILIIILLVVYGTIAETDSSCITQNITLPFLTNCHKPNNEVTSFLRDTESLICISYLGLAFALPELLWLIQNDTTSKTVWLKKCDVYDTIFNGDPKAYYTVSREVGFFNQCLHDSSITKKFHTGISFLKANRLKKIPKGIPVNKYCQIVKMFGNSDDYFGLSSRYYSLLILDGINLITQIKNDSLALIHFRRWIASMDTFAFVSLGLPTIIMERERTYLLEKYKNCSDPLMKEVLDKVRKAKIVRN